MTKSVVKPSIYVQESNLNSFFFVNDKLNRHKNLFSLKPDIYSYIFICGKHIYWLNLYVLTVYVC